MATGRIGVTPTLGTRWSKAPAGGTTSLSGLDDNSVSLVYSVGYEQVYRNGVLLSRGNDYTATTGNSITLIDATIAGDIIEVFANELVPLTDAISKGQFTAKGALLSATAASTPGVLTVGTNGQYLQADSTASTGLKWADVSAGAYTSLASGSIAASATGLDLTSISGSYTDLQLYITDLSVNVTAATETILFRVNNDSGNNYHYNRFSSATASIGASADQTAFAVLALSDAAAADATLIFRFSNYSDSTSHKITNWSATWASGAQKGSLSGFGSWTNTPAAINRITMTVGAGAFDGGSYILYGVK